MIFKKTEIPFFFLYSVSHDQTVMIWTMDLETYAVERVHIGRGHERSIECVDVDKNSSFLATGGWDQMLKIWAASKSSIGSKSFQN